MITIPTNGAYTQPNDSDISGDVYKSFNLDLVENRGRMRVGTRMVLGLDSTGAVVWDNVSVAFREFNTSFGNQIIGLAGQAIISSLTDYPGGGFGFYGGTRPTDLTSFNSDMEIYGSDLYITGATNLYKLTFGGTNVSTSLYASLGSASQHKLCAFSGTGLLYVTNNDNQIYSWNGSGMTTSGVTTLALTTPAKNNIAWIKAGSDKVWIGFNSNVNSAGSRGTILQWDGSQIIPNKEYKIDAPGTYGCVIKDDVPWTMDAYGRLLMWNGGTFIEKARLNRRTNALFNTGSPNAMIHSNGMAVINGRINILVNTAHYNATASLEDQIPSGIYEFDEKIGLYHKHSFGLSTSSGTITDWGASRLSAVGALHESNYPDLSASRNGTFVAGVDYYTDASTIKHGVFSDDSNDTLQKIGTYITPKIDSQNVTDQWNKVFLIYRKLLAATDKITMKYRTISSGATDFVGTWASSDSVSTTFQTTTNLTAFWTSGTGGEVEVITGVGSGRTAHITNITLAGSTYTVTIDESIPGTNVTSSTFNARADMWTKITQLLPMTGEYSELPINTPSAWIQLKMSMLFTGKNEIHKLILVNKPQQAAL